MKRTIILLFVSVAILSGCATKQFEVKDLNLNSGVKTMDFLIEPYQSLGVIETDAIKTGDVTVVKAIFADRLFGEFFPGRIRWNAIAEDQNGQEYFGQAIFSGISVTGDFLFTIVMDGKNIPSDAKALVFSTGLDFAYNFGGREFRFDRDKIGDGNYRKQFILANGSNISERKPDEIFFGLLKKWNRYQTPEFVLLSPLGEKELKEIAGINPKYSYSEKLVGSGHFALVLDYVGTAMSLAIDLMVAPGVPSEGWDYNSQLPSRRNMAFIIEYPLKLKQSLIKDINQYNANQLASQKGR